MKRVWQWFLGVLGRIVEGERLDDPPYEGDDANEYWSEAYDPHATEN